MTKEIEVYEEGNERRRRVNIEACFIKLESKIDVFKTEIKGELKGIKGRLERLNTFKAKCEDETQKDKEEFQQLRTDFNHCHDIHKQDDKTKEKGFSGLRSILLVLFAFSAFIISIVTMFLRFG